VLQNVPQIIAPTVTGTANFSGPVNLTGSGANGILTAPTVNVGANINLPNNGSGTGLASAAGDICWNCTYNGTNWIYTSNGPAFLLQPAGSSTPDSLAVYTAPSGTAGASITFSGTPTLFTDGTLNVNGNLVTGGAPVIPSDAVPPSEISTQAIILPLAVSGAVSNAGCVAWNNYSDSTDGRAIVAGYSGQIWMGSGGNMGFAVWPSVAAGAVLGTPGTMTLDSGGNLTTTGNIISSGGALYGIGRQCRSGTPGPTQANVFNIDWTTAAHLWIDSVNQGAIAFTSDYRTKKDIAPLGSSWERVKKLRPISYTQAEYTPPGATPRNDDSGKPIPMFAADNVERWGFLAHELQATLTKSAASGEKDQADTIQSPNPWTVIATLTKALQEAMARIETLEAKAKG
jgi:hypothetical protein